ncbi:MAG TPA: hypothetical protein VIW92_12545 [Thermoanaerobaculia bacterium]
METSIQKLVAISYLVVSLSHILQPRAWARFFIMLREKGEVGSLLNGLLHFPMGVLIVSFHNVWQGIPLIVTLMGWGLVVKGSLYLIWPQYGMRVLSRISIERAWVFAAGGVTMLPISGLIFYSLFDRGAL